MEELRKVEWDEGTQTMHKYDVKSLYPSMNMEKAVGVFRMMMFEENKYTIEEVNDMNDLLRLLLETRHFRYETEIYTQSKGVPIGGTLSGMLAELVL